MKQLDVKLLFDRLDLLAQRRLLHAELFSGSRYVPRLGDRNEEPKMPKVHCHISDNMNFAISIL